MLSSKLSRILINGFVGDLNESKYPNLLMFPLLQNGLISANSIIRINGLIKKDIKDIPIEIETVLDECLSWHTKGVYSISGSVFINPSETVDVSTLNGGNINFIIDLLSNRGEAANLNSWMRETVVGDSLIDYDLVLREKGDAEIYEECRVLNKKAARYITAAILHHKELTNKAFEFARSFEPFQAKTSDDTYKILVHVWSVAQQMIYNILRDFLGIDGINHVFADNKYFELKVCLLRVIQNSQFLLFFAPSNMICLESIESLTSREIETISSPEGQKITKTLQV